MNSAQSQGLAGLSGALNTQEQNEKDLGYLMQLRTLKKQEQQEQEQAQIAEQQYYQYLNEQADGLLASDKKKVNARAMKMQAAIKEQISLYGGDRRSFFKHGGHSLLGSYVNKIAESEEMQVFKDNKTNLVRIMDAQQKGMGGQLMERDLESLRRYNETGEGGISYGGLLNTIDMPSPDNYALGSQIPIDDILNNESNRLKILANYRMENPNDVNPSEESLLAYSSARYSGKGSNRSHIEHARRLAQLEAAKKTQKTATKTDKRQHNLVTYYQRALSNMKPGTAEDVLSTSTNMFKNSDNKLYQQLGLGNWKHSSTRMNLDREGISVEGWDWFHKMVNPSTRLAHSGELFKTSKNKVAQVGLQAEVDESGYVNLEPGADFYDMDGLSLDNNMLEPGKYNTKYKVLGISTAMKANTGDGSGQLLMEVLEDGKVDGDKTMEYSKELRTSVASPTTVIALEHPDGHIFYKELPLDEIETSNVVSNTMGDDAILNNLFDSQQLKNEIDQQAASIVAQDQIQLEQTLVATEQALSGNPYFNQEVADFSDYQTGDTRANIMMAFYSSVPAMYNINPVEAAKGNQFSVALASSGREAEDLFRNYNNNISDEDTILQWLDIANRNETSSTIQNNNEIAKRWILALRNYNDLNL